MKINVYKHEGPNGKCAYVTVMALKDKGPGIKRIQTPIRQEFVERDIVFMREVMLDQKDEYDYCVIPDSIINFEI